jgi:hypothetical protein
MRLSYRTRSTRSASPLTLFAYRLETPKPLAEVVLQDGETVENALRRRVVKIFT